MSDITIVHLTEGNHVISSEVYARGMEVTHQSVLKLIEKHKKTLESVGGPVGFEIQVAKREQFGGSATRFAWLNADRFACPTSGDQGKIRLP